MKDRMRKYTGWTLIILLTHSLSIYSGEWLPRRRPVAVSYSDRSTTHTYRAPVASSHAPIPAQYGVILEAPVRRSRYSQPVKRKTSSFAEGRRWGQPRYRGQSNDIPVPILTTEGQPKTLPMPKADESAKPTPKATANSSPQTPPLFKTTPYATSHPNTGGPVVISQPVAQPTCNDCWWQNSKANGDHLTPIEYFQNPFNNRWTIRAEAVRWRLQEDEFPTLATQGVASAFNPVPAALGQPSTQSILGGDLGGDGLDGGQLTIGWWLDPNHGFGLEGRAMHIQNDWQVQSVASTGLPILGVPFFNANTGAEAAALVAQPGVSSGSVTASFRSRLWAAEANIRTNHLIGPCSKLDLIAGFRAMGLEEEFSLSVQSLTQGANPTLTQSLDRFATRNRFYGGQIGAVAEFLRGRWSLEISTKAAIGNTKQWVDIAGMSSIQTAGMNPVGLQNGIFARPSNIGTYSRNELSWISELGVSVGYQLTDCLKVMVGYDLLYWSNVARPGDQFDRVVDPTNPTAPGSRPQPRFDDAGFWAQGVRAGLEFRY